MKKDLSKEISFLHETLHWLRETDYLIGTVELSTGGKSAKVTLSPKALEILKAIPNSVEFSQNGKTIGEELSEALSSAAKERVSELAKKALSYLFAIGWGSIGVD